ncbi:MAG: T9SS C-terminal target domain-containing protein [Cytophagales bacterium]|nr:MAG: T9SS C-terminal target domain-containing protein [Cytophagales bacterium]
MTHRLQTLCYCLYFSLLTLCAQAQVSFTLTPQTSGTLTTAALPVTAVCPGASLTVSFTFSGTLGTGNVFSAQLSPDNVTYSTLPSGVVSFTSSTPSTTGVSGTYSLTTTIPATSLPLTAYRLRVVASNPAILGTPSPTTLTVRPSPTAPVTQSVAVCQNTSAVALTATGQNLLWYTTPSGGTSTTLTPTMSTSAALRATYYVTQTLNGCESPRASLSVVVTATPNSPTVASASLDYCQGSPAQSLSATGMGLLWYTAPTGGTGVVSVTPNTANLGTITYFVGQSVNGCESGRSSVRVSVSAVPAAPVVASSVSVCQRSVPTTLTATGTSLRWYSTATGSTSLATAPLPPTTNTGTTSYFVTQTTGICESTRAETRVLVKPTPTAPTVAQQVVCQNSPAVTLFVTGQAIRWYASPISNEVLASAPVVNTNLAVVSIFYPTQTQDGCESPRGEASVLVRPLPLPPGLSPTNYCQFVRAQPVSATSSGLLRWFNVDGNPFPAPPTPITDQPASFSYLVSQTVDGCESPRAVLVVNVLSTPAPTVASSTVQLCLNAVAQSLQATGRGLRWTDPTGTVSASAPAPPTQAVTTNPDGLVYHVTQTGENGCESPRTAIRVFVLPMPTLSLSGSTTVNLGLEAPLRLTFTGPGPFQFRLSNGLAGTALRDTTVRVLPMQTTTYTVTEIRNGCGVGTAAGNPALVSVNVPTIQTGGLVNGTVCVGGIVSASFTANGTFNTGSQFRLQYARAQGDTAQAQFVDGISSSLPTGGVMGALLPTTLAAGTYWVRIIATNPRIPILGRISPTTLTVRPLPTASLTGTQTIYDTYPANLSIAFTGDGPWAFTYRDSTTTAGPVRGVQTNANPHILTVKPSQNTTYYLTGISNGCGTGPRPTAAVLVTVLPLLGVEDQSLSEALTVFPVPTLTELTIRIEGLTLNETARIELIDRAGGLVWSGQSRQRDTRISVADKPAGVYLLRVRVGDRRASRRVVRL